MFQILQALLVYGELRQLDLELVLALVKLCDLVAETLKIVVDPSQLPEGAVHVKGVNEDVVLLFGWPLRQCFVQFYKFFGRILGHLSLELVESLQA